jgi:hypothetical protein
LIKEKQIMINIALNWKEFNINLKKVEEKIKLDHPECCGASAGNELTLHFDTDSLDESAIEAIQSYWDGITSESDEAVMYQSAAEIAQEKEAKKAAGLAKLIALGLTEEEAKALVG